MSAWCAQRSPFSGELEADEPYFGPKRVRGKRGRGAGDKTIVFGLLKRGDDVYTEIVTNASKAILQAIIRGKADIASVIHTDHWRGYDGLVDVGFDKHHRVNHGESFWSFAKQRLAQFKGLPSIPLNYTSRKQSSGSITGKTICIWLC